MPVRTTRCIRAFLAGLVAASAVASTGAAARHATDTAQEDARLPVAMERLAPTPMPTIGQPAPEKYPDSPVTLNSLHRDSAGLVSLTWTVTNNGDSNYVIPTEFVSVYKYASASASAITLTDETGKIRYNPLRMDPSSTCICTDTTSIPTGLDKGESAVFNQVYKLPTGVNSVTVTIPGYSAAKNVSVS